MSSNKNFFLKHFGPSCIAGITASDLLILLAENGFRVSPKYWAKLPFLMGSSVVSTVFKAIEQAFYDSKLRELQVQSPIFILGNWRSGTTHLHNLLCLDERYSFSNMFQTMYPHTFLTCEFWARPLLDLMTPKKRFMDNMKQGLQEPHEDEMALCIASRRSNMLSWAFPRRADHYDRYLSFEGVDELERTIWKRELDYFVRKLTLKTGKRLVLKSPNHTARIKLLLELYPDAKFLHIKRNPYDVFKSMCHMTSEVVDVWGLQYFPPEGIPDMVIETYKRLYDAYLDQVGLIPVGNLHEVAYEDVVDSPVEQLEQTYAALGLGEFEAVRPKLEEYAAAKSGYKKNKHVEIPDEQRQQINAEWKRVFDAFGYEVRTSNEQPSDAD
ncbi:MAG: sulfotransferase [Planctomycetaceae bacterium]|nr:sulfotransferase [Planctomycetaceae bacterium]